MITPAYVRTMAVYNEEMNRRLYEAAARLSDEERRRDRGAFWHSIHGTLNHLLWGDYMWMTRFANWPATTVKIKESDRLIAEFSNLRAARVAADREFHAWAAHVTDQWLGETLPWRSAAVERDLAMPRSLLVTHLFNHQTHHRGQAHALITAAGEATGDTDLFILVPEIR
jgi:uncharacterized damage-inducible protein DinB